MWRKGKKKSTKKHSQASQAIRTVRVMQALPTTEQKSSLRCSVWIVTKQERKRERGTFYLMTMWVNEIIQPRR